MFLPEGDLDQDKLIDFGIAQRAQDGRPITRPGGTMGTPMQMAPEQSGADAEVDGRADVFSLGCVLFESLVGDCDQSFDRDEGTLHRSQQAAPPPLRDVLGRRLELAPDERPANAEELSHELRQAAQHISDGGVLASPPAKAPPCPAPSTVSRL